MKRLFLFLLAGFLLLSMGCQTTSEGPLTWTGNQSASSENPAESRPREETRPAQPKPERGLPTLELIDQSPRPSGGGLPANLTGKNKPDGIALRYRKEVPTSTPGYVRREYDGLELFIAETIPEEGWLAFYKGQCGSLGDVCAYRAILYNDDHTQRWALNLNRFLRQDRYVEIQDVRYTEDGQLLFNEACATYASEVQGQCSWLVSVDPVFQEETWRTPPMTSNNLFILHDRSIFAGYGFTGEPDVLYRIDARSGEVLARADLDSAHEYLEVQDDRLYVVTYRSIYTFAL